MSSGIIDLTVEIFLPENIKQDWIPLDGLPVPHLFQFTKYPPPERLYDNHSNLSQLLHGEDVINFDPQILLQLGPPPQKLSDRYKAAIRAASSPIHSFTLVPLSGDPVRFPTWVLDYWREIRHAVGCHYDWMSVLKWLRGIYQSESMVGVCGQVMAGLSYFPWKGGNSTVHDMASILTDSWLSDFHIDHVLMKISNCYCDNYGAEASSHHIFLPVVNLDSIVKAYRRGSVHSGYTADKCKQLLEVENDIIQGLVDSVAGVLYLPNHWTSLIITFKPPKILYGDSLGNSMPPVKAFSFRRWICHMLSRSGQGIPESDISIYPLETTIQQDFNSCGLFALNAIEHHYLQNSPLLQLDALSVAHNWMQIALGLLQEGAVSIFQ